MYNKGIPKKEDSIVFPQFYLNKEFFLRFQYHTYFVERNSDHTRFSLELFQNAGWKVVVCITDGDIVFEYFLFLFIFTFLSDKNNRLFFVGKLDDTGKIYCYIELQFKVW